MILPRDARAGSFFLAAVTPGGGPPHSREEFQRLVGMPPNLVVRTAGYDMSVLVSPESRACSDPRDGVTLVLHGEIYDGTTRDPARMLLERYRRSGPASLGDVDGTYAVLVVDEAGDALHLVTDRINSRRVFTGRRGKVSWLSTSGSLHLHPLPEVRPDVTGVAHYLVNGLAYNGHTPFHGLTVLGPASVHTFGGDGFKASRYWSLELTDEQAGVPEAKLRGIFHDLLLEAVRKRTRDAPVTFLSLSGGWDSSAILGAAHVTACSRLACISYGREDALLDEGTDPAVAQRMARDLGHPHRVVAGYADDLETAIGENERSHGTAQLVMEADVWRALASRVSEDGSFPPLLLGDQGVGARYKPLSRTPRSLLLGLRIRGMEGLGWLARGHADYWNPLHAALEEDLQSIVERVPPLRDVQDERYWLYLDQYLSRLLSWREFFAASSFRPRYPLLDHDLLDFVAGLPGPLRWNKRLLRETVTERFPELFRHPRAVTSGSPSVGAWCAYRLRREGDWARSWLQGSPSPLDDLLPAGLVLDVLDGRTGPGKARRGFERLEARAGDWLSGSALGARLGRRLGMGARKPTVRPPLFLVRALYLRRLFANRTPTAMGASREHLSGSLADRINT